MGPYRPPASGRPGAGSVTFDTVEPGDYLVTAADRDHLGAEVSLTVGDDPESVTVRLESGNPALGPTCYWRPLTAIPAFFAEQTERRNHTVNAREAAVVAARSGWRFDGADPGWLRSCELSWDEWEGLEPDGILLYAGSGFRSLSCTFTVFGGRELNEGWLIQSYDIISDECAGSFVINEEPEPGSTSPQLTITATDSGLFGGVCGVYVQEITLNGPVERDWREAFQ